MRTKQKFSKYPPYPSSGWDYAVIHSASTELRPPNKVICIYCRQQAKQKGQIEHKPDCPAKEDQ